jgi:phosphoribosylformimino-5-aminoimidazole carboxamide ribotide isomerase
MVLASGFDVYVAIDLRAGRVVRLRQGDFAQETAFSEDPIATARDFVEVGARWLHVVDLDGARAGAPAQSDTVRGIVDAVGSAASVEVAGGLRSVDAVGQAFASGAARVVVGTAAVRDARFAEVLVERHGADAVAAAIDVRDGRAQGHGWLSAASEDEPVAVIRRLASAGVTTFEVTAIDRDGMLAGPDLALYQALVDSGGRGIIASGGISTVADLKAVRDVGCIGAIVGRAIYEGRLSVRDALSAQSDETGAGPPGQ